MVKPIAWPRRSWRRPASTCAGCDALTADAIRNEKVKVLQSIVPPSSDDVARCVVRAQYTGGRVGDEAVVRSPSGSRTVEIIDVRFG